MPSEQPTSNPRLDKMISLARGSSGQWFEDLVAEIERQARQLAFNDMELRKLGGEIASLTAELATMREAHGTYVELYPKVCIERDRLRTALELAKAYVYANQGGWCRDGIGSDAVLGIVNSALAGAPDETTESP